jgi:hypothetical protein
LDRFVFVGSYLMLYCSFNFQEQIRMASSDNDELMDDLGIDEVVPSNINDPPPEEGFQSVWDDPHIVKLYLDGGEKQWKCCWCGRTFKHHNATKALFHVNKIAGRNIKCCTGNMSLQWRQCYKEMMGRTATKKIVVQQQASRFSALQDRNDRAAMSSVAKLKSSSGKKSHLGTIELTTPQAGGLTKWLNSGGAASTGSKRQIQTKLDKTLPNPEVNQEACTKIARYVIDNGLPLSTVEDALFRRMLLGMKHVGSDFMVPNRSHW